MTDGDPLIFLVSQCFSSCDANESEKRFHRSRAQRSKWLGFTLETNREVGGWERSNAIFPSQLIVRVPLTGIFKCEKKNEDCKITRERKGTSIRLCERERNKIVPAKEVAALTRVYFVPFTAALSLFRASLSRWACSASPAWHTAIISACTIANLC